MNPIIMPYLNNLAMTKDAVADCLAQTLAVHLLLIDQGSREELDLPEQPNLLRWRHDPPLPSLSATWNRALRWAWESGAEHALVVNNDTRILPETYTILLDECQRLGGLFVSATGVTPEQYDTYRLADAGYERLGSFMPGPDFSCYLITRECHEKYPFDESYIPGYCEDLDYHRRLMLGGDGQRIFGTGLPFAHLGSGTLNDMTAEKRLAWEARITQGSRAHHRAKWGGEANQEIYQIPFDETSRAQGVTTAALFQKERERWANR